MDIIIVLIIIGLALAFVGRNFYKQFTGKGSCLSRCPCTPEVKHHCADTHDSSNNPF